MRTAAAVALALSTGITAQNGAAQSSGRGAPPASLGATLAPGSRPVEADYLRARSSLCPERGVMHPLGYDLAPVGFARQLVYELRIEWEPSEAPAAPAAPAALGAPREPREPGSPADGDA